MEEHAHEIGFTGFKLLLETTMENNVLTAWRYGLLVSYIALYGKDKVDNKGLHTRTRANPIKMATQQPTLKMSLTTLSCKLQAIH